MKDYLDKEHVVSAAESIAINWAKFIRRGLVEAEEDEKKKFQRENEMAEEADRMTRAATWVKDQQKN